MTVRWAYLDSEEKETLEQYDLRMAYLLGRRTIRRNPKLESAISTLHQKMDLFIMRLCDKYCAKP